MVITAFQIAMHCWILEAMNETGISVLQNYPGLNLRGKGIMIGFLDTGIDYENEIFRNIDGSSRITAIWDQTDQNGQPPDTFTYGSEYTNNQINQALKSDNPKEIVPVSDENGHGTFLCKCGSRWRKYPGRIFRGGIRG